MGFCISYVLGSKTTNIHTLTDRPQKMCSLSSRPWMCLCHESPFCPATMTPVGILLVEFSIVSKSFFFFPLGWIISKQNHMRCWKNFNSLWTLWFCVYFHITWFYSASSWFLYNVCGHGWCIFSNVGFVVPWPLHSLFFSLWTLWLLSAFC